MEIKNKELKINKSGEEYPDGYRIVYFYDNNYSIGEYCKTIEGFMMGFAEKSPIIYDIVTPKFTTIDDLLSRCFNDVPSAKSIAIYKTDGTLIAQKEKIKSSTK